MPELRSASDFEAWSVPHLVALLCTALLTVCAWYVGRRATPRWRKWITGGFAAVWGGVELYWVFSTVALCDRARDCLPLHLCDISIFLLVLALLTQRRFAFEFSYFFGIGGTLQALITPDLRDTWPSAIFLRFFVGHGGIIVGVVLLASTFRLRPYAASILRVFGYGILYMVAIALFNWLMDTNYGYVCRKPDQPSLLDKLGPWPWYIVWAQAIIFVNLLILYAPFYLHDLVKGRRVAGERQVD